MSPPLDEHSRHTIGRFIIKLVASALLASFGRLDYLPEMVTWISLYAVLTSAFALISQEKFMLETFNHWDEALWLIFLALAFTMLHRFWGQA